MDEKEIYKGIWVSQLIKIICYPLKLHVENMIFLFSILQTKPFLHKFS